MPRGKCKAEDGAAVQPVLLKFSFASPVNNRKKTGGGLCRCGSYARFGFASLFVET
jgi:hypothetical protein